MVAFENMPDALGSSSISTFGGGLAFDPADSPQSANRPRRDARYRLCRVAGAVLAADLEPQGGPRPRVPPSVGEP